MLAVDGIAGSMYTPSAFRTQARSTYAEDSVSAWFLWHLGSGRHKRVESLNPTRKPRGLFPSVEGRSPASNRTVFLRVRLFRVRTNRLFATVILVVLKSEVLPCHAELAPALGAYSLVFWSDFACRLWPQSMHHRRHDGRCVRSLRSPACRCHQREVSRDDHVSGLINRLAGRKILTVIESFERCDFC